MGLATIEPASFRSLFLYSAIDPPHDCAVRTQSTHPYTFDVHLCDAEHDDEPNRHFWFHPKFTSKHAG